MLDRIPVLVVVLFLVGSQVLAEEVEIRRVAAEHRVDVSIGGKHFTSYHYGPDFRDMPIFYPVHSSGGNMVNRGYPMREDLEEETRDHPHHKSLFFGYGTVNGVNFWSPRGGPRVAHKGVVGFAGGETGYLEVIHEWIDQEDTTLLQERRKVTFGGDGAQRWMDHDITLTALERKVVFGDTKEGMFAFRVARSLEERLGEARYVNAYGGETEKNVWGKRAPWVALQGEVDGERITLAVFDHPDTDNHPSYWHARAYGLFAVNPLGRAEFVEGVEPINTTLRPYESLRLRYRVVVYSEHLSKQDLDTEYWEYVK